jgi:hypothetical protein
MIDRPCLVRGKYTVTSSRILVAGVTLMLPVSLAPRPGFCIKSTTLPPGIIYPGNNLIEPAIDIPLHRKVFVNTENIFGG